MIRELDQDGLGVDFYGHFGAFYYDVLSPPFVVLGWRQRHIHEAIQAAGFDPIPLSHIHLAFETGLGPTRLLKSGVEVNAAV